MQDSCARGGMSFWWNSCSSRQPEDKNFNKYKRNNHRELLHPSFVQCVKPVSLLTTRNIYRLVTIHSEGCCRWSCYVYLFENGCVHCLSIEKQIAYNDSLACNLYMAMLRISFWKRVRTLPTPRPGPSSSQKPKTDERWTCMKIDFGNILETRWLLRDKVLGNSSAALVSALAGQPHPQVRHLDIAYNRIGPPAATQQSVGGI